MCVDGNRRFTKSRIQHNVGGFTAYTGQCLEFFPISRHLSVMFFQQNSTSTDDIPGLAVVKTNGLDISLEAFLTEFGNCSRRVGDRVKFLVALLTLMSVA